MENETQHKSVHGSDQSWWFLAYLQLVIQWGNKIKLFSLLDGSFHWRKSNRIWLSWVIVDNKIFVWVPSDDLEMWLSEAVNYPLRSLSSFYLENWTIILWRCTKVNHIFSQDRISIVHHFEQFNITVIFRILNMISDELKCLKNLLLNIIISLLTLKKDKSLWGKSHFWSTRPVFYKVWYDHMNRIMLRLYIFEND